jgi:hypothetical protein
MKRFAKNILEFPLDKTEIESLTEKDIDKLVSLDQKGLLIGYKDDILSYKKRLSNIESEIQSLKEELEIKGKIELFHKVYATKNNLISTDILTEASEYTKKVYNFSVNWIPGFYLTKGLGLLTGGCAATTETGFTFFLIRSGFSSKNKWLWYSRNELLSHELCHAAREPVKDRRLEEFFAYKLSTSPLRRYLGNCFQGTFDAILLLLPLFLLLAMQVINTFFHATIPIIIFWIIAFIYPSFLLIRNQLYRNYYFKAQKSLFSAYGNNIPSDSILFRCNSKETIQIGKFINSPTELKKWIEDNTRNKLRWKIITKRFIAKNVHIYL